MDGIRDVFRWSIVSSYTTFPIRDGKGDNICQVARHVHQPENIEVKTSKYWHNLLIGKSSYMETEPPCCTPPSVGTVVESDGGDILVTTLPRFRAGMSKISNFQKVVRALPHLQSTWSAALVLANERTKTYCYAYVDQSYCTTYQDTPLICKRRFPDRSP